MNSNKSKNNLTDIGPYNDRTSTSLSASGVRKYNYPAGLHIIIRGKTFVIKELWILLIDSRIVMKYLTFLSVVILGLILHSCKNNEQHIIIPSFCYDIDYIDTIGAFVYEPPYPDFKAQSNERAFPMDGDLESRLMFSRDKSHHNYEGTTLELEFDRLKINSKEHKDRRARCNIGVNSENKAFYFYWFNVPYDSLKTTYGEKIYKYNWEICEYTDTLYSNIDYITIKKIFPKFKGIFKQQKIDKIKINRDYHPNERRFYDEIKFSNFDLGYPFCRYYDGK